MKDLYGREINYLRLSVTDRCNLRCRYCMPSGGVCQKKHEDMLTEDEMVQAVTAATSLGISKLRLTGGEPLVQKNILSICERCAAVPGIKELCITTNGILLPRMAKQLRSAGVDRLNISLDTLDEDKYAHITRIGTLHTAEEGFHAALDAGFSQIKINAVLIGGFNDDEISSLAALTLRYPVDVRFIELMPMLGNEEFGYDAYLPCDAVLKCLPELKPVETQAGCVTKLYQLPHAQGNVGLISAVSNCFCSGCNRIRLTADGKLKPCLHSDQEYFIKGLNYEEMRCEIERTILSKPPYHLHLSAEDRSCTQRSMSQIGG